MTKLAVEKFKNYIQKETQALELEFEKEINNGTDLDIDGVEIKVAITVVS